MPNVQRDPPVRVNLSVTGSPAERPALLRILRAACTLRIAVSSCRLALVVGLVLNTLNWEGLVDAAGGLRWGHLLANFLVPFCVASYSAARNQLDRFQETA